MTSQVLRNWFATCAWLVAVGLLSAVLSARLAQAADESGKSSGSLTPWPPDLPLPTAKPMGGWIATARIVQPAHTTEWLVMREHKAWAKRFTEEFGFNAICVSVSDSHNATANPISPAYGYDKTGTFRYDDELFTQAMEDFRAAGLRTIMYTSIMHCGHAWKWETGELGKEHPDWSQVDAKGTAIMQYGRPWMCPSSPAFDYCLQWTIQAVERWKFDAVMLDNNEFFTSSNAIPSCYCKYCQAAFRQYVTKRFGPGQARRFLKVDDLDTMRIPTDANSELYRLWKHWRSRVWKEATERFRQAMRCTRPDIVLLANAQPLAGTWAYASELQIDSEDATLTETRGMATTAMAHKMRLCQALGRGRPVISNPSTWQGDWRQCLKATYTDGVFRDPTPLQTPEIIRIQCAVGLANNVNPWVVFVGLANPGPSAQAVVAQMQLAKRWHDQSTGAEPYANVVSLFSTRQRDYLGGGERSLLPRHLEQLRKAQIPMEPLCDRHLPGVELALGRAVIAEGTTCLADGEVRALVGWVKRGGTLLATPDVGTCDEVGRQRPSSLLAELLGVTSNGTHTVGSGLVVWFARGSDVTKALHQYVKPILQIEPSNSEWEVTAYRQQHPEQFWIHLIAHGSEAPKASQLSIYLPQGLQIARANLWFDSTETAAQISQEGCCLRVSLPAAVPCMIVKACADVTPTKKASQDRT